MWNTGLTDTQELHTKACLLTERCHQSPSPPWEEELLIPPPQSSHHSVGIWRGSGWVGGKVKQRKGQYFSHRTLSLFLKDLHILNTSLTREIDTVGQELTRGKSTSYNPIVQGGFVIDCFLKGSFQTTFLEVLVLYLRWTFSCAAIFLCICNNFSFELDKHSYSLPASSARRIFAPPIMPEFPWSFSFIMVRVQTTHTNYLIDCMHLAQPLRNECAQQASVRGLQQDAWLLPVITTTSSCQWSHLHCSYLLCL